jgi:flagellar assembly factor FliW
MAGQMAQAQSRYFGVVDYKPEDAVQFPVGLPAFEDARQFALVAPASHAPLVFLQSLQDKDLCFITIPIELIAPDYELTLEVEEVGLLGAQVDPPTGLLRLAVICLHSDLTATVNLLAPVVVNPITRLAVQSVRCDQKYSHEHPLAPVEPLCS